MRGEPVRQMILSRFISTRNHDVLAPTWRPTLHRICWLWALLLGLALPSCSDRSGRDTSAPETASVVGRVLTPELWAGTATSGDGPSPAVEVRSGDGQLTIRGLIEARHPVKGHLIKAYERVVHLEQGRKRQLLTVTQSSAGLGRILEQRSGLPDRRFTGDVVFPLGIWAQGEAREFEATEFTIFGPARRLITLEILDIDHVYEGVKNSLSYRLTIRDEAGRMLDCESSIYSPGRGLVDFESSNIWRSGTICDTCPCPG
jgi:hypothetical protein